MSEGSPKHGARRHHDGRAASVPVLDDAIVVRSADREEAIDRHTRRIAAQRRRRATQRDISPAKVLAAFRRGMSVEGVADYFGCSVAAIESVLRVTLRERSWRCRFCAGRESP